MTEFCSQRSLMAGEPLFATAVHNPVWLMLEYRRPWGARATSDHELPTAVSAQLAAQLQTVNGRLQFIRQMGRGGPELTAFVGVVDDRQPVLYRFEFRRYAALLDLDLAALAARDPAFADRVETTPRIFVCTNGKRDRCCALFGAALYRQLADLPGAQVWQTTHLGGHRFAPTVLTLPDGLCHGRVTPESAPDWLAARAAGRLVLDQLRGRVCYDSPTQAAESFLRRATGESRVDAFRHAGTEAGDDDWRVAFTAVADATRHILTLRSGAPLALSASCDSTAVKQIPQFELVAHTAV